MTNIQHGTVVYREHGDTTTKITYIAVGYGIDAQTVYGKRITTFTVADGVKRNDEYIAPTCFYRH